MTNSSLSGSPCLSSLPSVAISGGSDAAIDRRTALHMQNERALTDETREGERIGGEWQIGEGNAFISAMQIDYVGLSPKCFCPVL